MNVSAAVIVILLALLGGATWAWQSDARALASLRGEIVATERTAQQQAAKEKQKSDKIVKDTNREWTKRIAGIEQAAVDRYVHRFGDAARLCPPADGLRLYAPANDLPAAAQGAEVHAQREPERLACNTGFIAACAEDALARKLTRDWAMRNNLEAEQ